MSYRDEKETLRRRVEELEAELSSQRSAEDADERALRKSLRSARAELERAQDELSIAQETVRDLVSKREGAADSKNAPRPAAITRARFLFGGALGLVALLVVGLFGAPAAGFDFGLCVFFVTFAYALAFVIWSETTLRIGARPRVRVESGLDEADEPEEAEDELEVRGRRASPKRRRAK